MSLYYRNNGVKPSSLKDIPIESGVIARYTNLSCTIYYLTTGNHIRIPWEIMDLFFSLDIYSGNRILSLKPENNLERVIWLFVRFVNLLNNSRGEQVISVLSDILELGTGDLRDWYLDRFNKKLDPIEFFGLDKNFEI